MKRVKAACILQTLMFAQKDDCGMTREQQFKVNHDEVTRYKDMLDRSRTRLYAQRCILQQMVDG